jgi:polysaccharide export outer membrane protein
MSVAFVGRLSAPKFVSRAVDLIEPRSRGLRRRIEVTMAFWSRVVPCGLAILGLSASLVSAQATSPKQTERSPEGEYLLRAGDVVQIFVWKEPDLTREVTVRLDGRITMPLLGDVEASGRTPQELSKELGSRLGKLIENPVVTVSLTQPNSSRFFVIGQVGQSGGYPLTGSVTVLQALALAGGFKDFAKTEKILVIRSGSGAAAATSFNYKRIEDGSDLAQNVVLQAGDTILVP